MKTSAPVPAEELRAFLAALGAAAEGSPKTEARRALSDWLQDHDADQEAAALRVTHIHVSGRRWFQRSYGNTYHTATVTVWAADTGPRTLTSAQRYGYGEQYVQTAADVLEAAGLLPFRADLAHGYEQLWTYCRRMGIELTTTVTDVKRERDL